MTAAYLDASAAVKLVVQEVETAALRSALLAWPARVSSELLAIELARTTRRHLGRTPRGLAAVLSGCLLHPIDTTVVRAAVAVEPPGVATLDAIHLATGLLLRQAIGAFITYDKRLAEAARGVGLPVLSPA